MVFMVMMDSGKDAGGVGFLGDLVDGEVHAEVAVEFADGFVFGGGEGAGVFGIGGLAGLRSIGLGLAAVPLDIDEEEHGG
jgi:hypothetical protein